MAEEKVNMTKQTIRGCFSILVFGVAFAASAAVTVVSPEAKIIAAPVGDNADWGQIRAANVTLNWAWPKGATSAELKIVANGKQTVLQQALTDTAVSSYVWTCGTPTADMLYDVTLTFDNDIVQKAQLTALRGSFGGVPLNGWEADGSACVSLGTVLPFRSSWTNGLAGAATFSIGTELSEQPYSDGYLCFRTKMRGRQLATLDFATEPDSPAFARYFDIITPGLLLILR